MSGPLPIGLLTALHAAMGAGLGFAASLGTLAFDLGGFATRLAAVPNPAELFLVMTLSVAALLAAGSGISGFIFINLERAQDTRPGGTKR